MSESMIEDYRRTLAALNELLEKKKQQGADCKQLRLICEEIDEVAETLCHLQKGEERYQWKLP